MSESNIPENVSYIDSHEWIQVESDIATIGITEFINKNFSRKTHVKPTNSIFEEFRQFFVTPTQFSQ